MNLVDYLSAERGRAANLAVILGIPAPLLSQWRSERPVPADRCPDIERATGGAVTAEELRVDIRWVRVADSAWPHPSGRPCIDVATEARAA